MHGLDARMQVTERLYCRCPLESKQTIKSCDAGNMHPVRAVTCVNRGHADERERTHETARAGKRKQQRGRARSIALHRPGGKVPEAMLTAGSKLGGVI